MKKRRSLQDKAEMALREAINEVIERHIKTGRPLAVWKNGKVVRISPAKVTPRSPAQGRGITHTQRIPS